MKLTDILQPGFIKVRLYSSTKIEVIKELLSLLADHKAIGDQKKILEAILEREKVMTTGVGNGVAIPHCKSGHLQEFVVTMGLHQKGVDFQSLDQQPAHIIFLLIGPDNKPGTHIHLLSRISRIISKEAVRKKLLACKSPLEIYEFLKQQEMNYVRSNP